VAVPVYGCGYIHENSAWIPIFDKMTAEKRKRWVEPRSRAVLLIPPGRSRGGGEADKS
jgi:hypothetical protein